MLTSFQWFSLVSILLGTYAGGIAPLLRKDRVSVPGVFSSGQAFTAGVFLALALTMMLPSSFHLFNKAVPGANYPIASAVAITAFVILLMLDQVTNRLQLRKRFTADEAGPVSIPLIMTAMIAVPSFFLGTALGVSETRSAVLIFIAIMVHKSSAAFALALKMVRSRLTVRQSWFVFSLFACATPVGILAGGHVHQFLGYDSMIIIKAVVLSLAGGTFLYMGILHELGRTPLIAYCSDRKGFALMMCGVILTVLVRWLIGEAHRL